MIKPFLKWAGGKRQLLLVILPLIPKKFNTYYEPFLGGGAVFFAIQPKKAVINDLNEHLINCYRVVRDAPSELMRELAHYENTQEFYTQIKNAFNKGPMGSDDASKNIHAAMFLYLNKTGFNGLYRVNSQGDFNIPFGRYKTVSIANAALIYPVSYYLVTNSIAIFSSDFSTALKGARENDFIYLDPPYDPLPNTRSFTQYQSSGFSEFEQKRLKDVCDTLTQRNAKWLLSNADTPFIRELYREYRMIEVQARRNINCDGSQRGPIGELLIMNYEETKQ